jgi:hypothetical protein
MRPLFACDRSYYSLCYRVNMEAAKQDDPDVQSFAVSFYNSLTQV